MTNYNHLADMARIARGLSPVDAPAAKKPNLSRSPAYERQFADVLKSTLAEKDKADAEAARNAEEASDRLNDRIAMDAVGASSSRLSILINEAKRREEKQGGETQPSPDEKLIDTLKIKQAAQAYESSMKDDR
ncbi:MAG: hypothetical protein LBI17_00265 [Rickettsiales bacterium]|jgi:hypothetical protein|nr:hypothetical protein [Rickettsiales bacterium]